MPLTLVQQGRTVRVVAVRAGCGVQGRLSAMGLVPGALVEVLRNGWGGPFLISVKGSRIALGRGMAGKIEVE